MEKRSVDVVVLSDLHLGTYGSRAKEITSYLRSIAPQMLILNGDIIDIWQFSKHYFPSAHFGVIKEILQMMSNGTRVIYITGNHDETLRRYSGIDLGNFQLTDKLVVEINNKMTWIFHGDVFDNTTKGGAKVLAKLGSTGYSMLIMLNRFINSCLKFFGQERISLSKKVMEGVNKAVAKVNDLETIASELAIEKKYDYVICGHIHQPAKKTVTTEKGSVVYLNSGDWIEHLTALEYFNNDWHLHTYDATQAAFDKPVNDKPIVNVVSEEIHFYINSLAV
ncbi:MAG: UDP-2,3-diacylglucosamine diphosphatase [Chitinophagaceae bacterium]